jgi:hypothetical protein
MSRSRKNFIQEMHMDKGSLRRALHVKNGENISEKKLNKASHSSNKSLRKKAILAKTLKSMHH